MKFGVILPNYGPLAGPLWPSLDTAQAAESLGFDSAWADRPHGGARKRRPNLHAHLRGRHHRRLPGRQHGQHPLGISALVLPQRNPYEVAKAARHHRCALRRAR